MQPSKSVARRSRFNCSAPHPTLVGVERVFGLFVGPVVVHFGTAPDWSDQELSGISSRATSSRAATSERIPSPRSNPRLRAVEALRSGWLCEVAQVREQD